MNGDTKSGVDTVKELRWYLLSLLIMALAGACYVWYSEPPVPAPPVVDTTAIAPGIGNAIEAALSLANEEPDSGEARGRLGMILLAHGFRAEALECFAQAVRLEPSHFRWRYYRAILEEEIDLANAAVLYKQAFQYRTEYAPLYVRLANILVRLDRETEARLYYTKAVKIDPNSPYPLLGLARLEMRLGSLPAARDLIDRAQAVAPWLREAAIEKARILRMEGDLAEAARVEEAAGLPGFAHGEMPDEFLNEIAELQISSIQMAKRADLLLAEGKLEEAAELLKQLILDRPDVARLRLSLGQIRMQQQNPEQALRIFRETVEQFPNDPAPRFFLGTVLESQGQLNEAVKAYSEASIRKPDYTDAFYREGRVWNKLGIPEQAVSPLKSALAADPSQARIHLELARTFQSLRRWAEARHSARNAARIDPIDPETQELLRELETESAPLATP